MESGTSWRGRAAESRAADVDGGAVDDVGVVVPLLDCVDVVNVDLEPPPASRCDDDEAAVTAVAEECCCWRDEGGLSTD